VQRDCGGDDKEGSRSGLAAHGFTWETVFFNSSIEDSRALTPADVVDQGSDDSYVFG
jgi:hypothetical protein